MSAESRQKISEVQKGQRHSPKTEFKKGLIPWNISKVYKQCLLCDKSFRVVYNRKLYCSSKCSNKKTPWNKGKHSDYAGERHWNWQGGKTAEADRIKNSLEYRLWRIAVFTRDNFTCIKCGDNRGGNLEADHIKPQSKYPELRFAIDNGRTLCVDCHKQTETWGKKARLYASS